MRAWFSRSNVVQTIPNSHCRVSLSGAGHLGATVWAPVVRAPGRFGAGTIRRHPFRRRPFRRSSVDSAVDAFMTSHFDVMKGQASQSLWNDGRPGNRRQPSKRYDVTSTTCIIDKNILHRALQWPKAAEHAFLGISPVSKNIFTTFVSRPIIVL